MMDKLKRFEILEEKVADEMHNKYFGFMKDKSDIIITVKELVKKGYTEDYALEKYQKDDNSEFEYQSPSGKKYQLYGYTNCHIVNRFLVDDKQKIYRALFLQDLMDFDTSRMYLYKKKYACICEKQLLLFPNTSQVLISYIDLVDDLEPLLNNQLYDLYVLGVDNETISTKKNVVVFREIDDDFAKKKLIYYYHRLMIHHLWSYEKDNEITLSKQANQNNMDMLEFAPFYPKYIDFCEKVLPIDYFLKEVTRKREIWKNIKNSIVVNELFVVNNKDEDYFIYGEDYTFLIVNLVKAFEFLLYNILSEKNIKMPDDKDIDDRAMLNTMIQLIKDSKDKLLREDIKEYITDEMYNKFIEDLEFIKDECRNGYFHKERMDNYRKLRYKYVKTFYAIIKTIALIGR